MSLWVEETEFAEVEFSAVSAFVAISDYSFPADFAYNARVKESVGAGPEDGRWLSCYGFEQRVQNVCYLSGSSGEEWLCPFRCALKERITYSKWLIRNTVNKYVDV